MERKMCRGSEIMKLQSIFNWYHIQRELSLAGVASDSICAVAGALGSFFSAPSKRVNQYQP